MITTDYEDVSSFQNLYEGYEKIRRKRRPTQGQIRFERNLSHELIKLTEELKNHTYIMSPGRRFLIREPKKRWIMILPFRDKIMQKLLCENSFQPYLESHSIYDSAACQKGKGVSFACKRLTKHLRNYYKEHGNKGYILKGDIRNFYPSIDTRIVKQQWLPQIQDKQLRHLIETIIDAHPKGLAMGNQLSTIFAVYYLNPMDRYIKEKQRIKYYSRYVDDFVILSQSKQELRALQTQLELGLKGRHLELNKKKTMIVPIKQGIDYVGWHFYLTDTGKVVRRLRKASKIRMKRKLKDMNWKLRKGMLSMYDHNKKYRGMMAYIKQGDTYQLSQRIRKEFSESFQKHNHCMKRTK